MEELKQDIAIIKNDLKHILSKVDGLPCADHEEDIQENALNIEKSKTWAYGTFVTLVFTVLALVGTLYSAIGK